MHDELTKQDIRLMQQELEDRIQNQRPVLLEEVKRCREFGDLSENFEYKEAKRAKNRNESRIRYLQNMIKTAHLIDEAPKQSSVVGLFDKVVLYFEEDEMEQTIQVVTTIRTDPDQGLISKESPWARPSSAAASATESRSRSALSITTPFSSAPSRRRRTTAPPRFYPSDCRHVRRILERKVAYPLGAAKEFV